MGATFHVEPLLTYDLDVFVELPQTTGALLSLASLYSELRRRGYKETRECVDIEGVPVQFLPAYNPLIEEALHDARDVEYDGVSTRVFHAEHLAAIFLQAGRDKDRGRVRILGAQTALDDLRLLAILDRHGLRQKWTQWTT